MINIILKTKNIYINKYEKFNYFIKWNFFNLSIIIYSNTEIDRLQILSDNKGKTDIYLWNHKESNKIYIDSAANLEKRFKSYYFKIFISKAKINSYIYNALLNHGYKAFFLEIIRYINVSSYF